MAPPLPRSHLRVDSGGKGILLEIPAYSGPFNCKQIFFSPPIVSLSMVPVFEHILACCSLGLCYLAIVTVFSIMLQHCMCLLHEEDSTPAKHF